MNVRVAAIQAEAIWGEGEWQNAERAVRYLEEAARTGAQLVCFPEGYPGPAHGPLDSGGRLREAPLELLCRKTREVGVYVAASNVEENPDLPGTYFLCQKLISPEGRILADHKRVQPDEPDLNEYLFGGRRDFAPGKELTVVDTELGKIGLLICSELFVPELPRIEMLMGAEILIAPVNGLHTRSAHYGEDPELWETWRCISRARAAENLVYVVVTQNMFVPGYKGVGHIAGPERMLAQSKEPGIFTADLDMARLRWIRSHIYNRDMFMHPERVEIQLPLGCRPAQHILRRPEVYRKLLEPLPADFDYYYYLKERRG